MLTRMRNRTEAGGEGGFTLIELLVVIIIIGILAAIAIPMYLSQRTKGYNATAQSDLRNAAVAEESFFTDGNNAYTAALADLKAQGYNPSNTIDPANGGTFTAVVVDASTYCLTAQDKRGGVPWYLTNASGGGAPTDVKPAGC